MKNIKEHIKAHQFKPVYLLYGAEGYLKKLYRDKLVAAILNGADQMNYSHYDGKGIDVSEVIGMAETLPFFSEKRVIVIENSGFFKVQNELADYLKTMPDTTHMIFVEDEVDKRNRLYKAVKDIGNISEMNGMDEQNMKLWAASILQKDKKKITSDTLTYLFNKIGMDMQNVQTELEKLVCYAYDRDIITIEDIEEVCTTQIQSKIFAMIDAIGMKQSRKAFDLYADLLALREKPMTILYLITRQFNILLQVKELSAMNFDKNTIASKAGIPPFAVQKSVAQAKNFTKSTLKEALEFSADVEEQVKTGRLSEKLGVELLIVKYSAETKSA